MNFKRILVLVMALVMMVSACATSVSAAFKPETKHEHIEDVLNNPELKEKYEEIKAAVEYVAKDIEENHEKYYAEGYEYASDNDYIDTAIVLIELALETLPEINLDDVGMTPELRNALETELDALAPTLEELLAILENPEVSEFDGFLKAVVTLEDDLYLHLNNINAILKQGSIDLNQEILVPAFDYAMEILNEKILPALDEVIDSFVDAVVEALTPYYNAALEVIGIARDTYETVVETIIRINLYVEGTIDTVVNAYNALVGMFLEIYGTVENTIVAINNAIKTAHEVINNVIDSVIEFNAKVENTINNVQNFIVRVTDAYKRTVKVLVYVYGEVKNAVIVAGQVLDSLVDLWIENKPLIETGVITATEVLSDVVEILEIAYAEKEDVYYVATKISEYVVETLNAIDNAINDTLNGAYEGNYELKDDSYYVSFGNADYSDALANKLNLANKHTVATFGSDYIDQLTNADLVTVKLDNGSFMSLAEAQIEGKLAEILKSNSDLMSWYNGIDDLKQAVEKFFWMSREDKDELINGLESLKQEINSFVDLEAEPVELDWDKYLDEEGKEALDKLLAKVREKVLEDEVPEYYYIDLNPVVDELFTEYGLGGVFTLSLDPIEVPVADLVVFAVENMIYGYAEFIGNLTYVLENASNDATIVLTPVSNPLYGYSLKGMDFSAYAESADSIVELLNAHLYGLALINENVVFVNSENADDIYDALNVYCDHVISGCTDTQCDRCLANVTAPGHSFTQYEFTASTSCRKDGTETAKCDNCDATNTRTVPGTKGEHDFAAATCTSLARCKVCGLKTGEMLPHELGDWRITKDPTSKTDGTREKKCLHCEYKIVEAIPHNTLSTIALVGIIVGGVAIVGALAAMIAGFFRKKNMAK